MSYADLSDYKLYVERVGDDSEDALLTMLLAQASAAIDHYCRRPFAWEGAAVARTFDAIEDVRDRRLRLDRDCASVTSVVNGDGVTLAASDYILEPRNYAADGIPIRSILLKASSGVSWTYEDDPEGAISVTGMWAYSVAPPEDIVQATLELAKFLYDSRKADAADLNRPIATGGETILPSRWPPTTRRVLDLYRKRRIVT